MSRKQTIMDIYKDMNFGEEISNDSGSKENAIKNIALKADQMEGNTKQPFNLNDIIEITTRALIAARTITVRDRANILYKIGQILSENKFFNEGAQYFDYYSDLLVVTEILIQQLLDQITLVILPQDFPPFILCSTVAGALAGGSSVIIQCDHPEAVAFQNAVENAGLPKGLCTVISHSTPFSPEDSLKKINHVILYGEVSSIRPSYKISRSLKYICPNATSAIFLESCDLSAALNKILMETWGPSCSMWGVSTLIVQESIYKKFEEKLKIQLQNFPVNRKYEIKFKDSLNSYNELIEKAEKAGCQIIRQTIGNGWSPTLALQCQDQTLQSDLLILKVMTCRTASEGVSLLNNTLCGLGTSIWTEISSQALEVAAELTCLNIWVNCHGCFSADKPLRPLNMCGNFTCGGVQGMMQFEDVKPFKTNLNSIDSGGSGEESLNKPDKSLRQSVNSLVHLNLTASQSWKRNTKRKRIVKGTADHFDDSLSKCLNFYCHLETISDYGQNFCEGKFFTIQHPVPVGVIAIILDNASAVELVGLLTPALVLGNSVIVALKKKSSELSDVLEIFRKNLPKNVLEVLVGEESAELLASDPTIHEFWLCGRDTDESVEFHEKIIHLLNKNLKTYWMTPTTLKSFPLMWRKCLHQKIIWLPKVDKFP